MHVFRLTVPGTVILLLLLTACKKDPVLQEGGRVTFSVDTLMFDTVFTDQGSATRSIKVFNPQKEAIHISSIRLKRGGQSPFTLNINGNSGKEIQDIDLSGKDSLWIFSSVFIDPTDEDNPFIISDELIVTLNDNEFTIPFYAYGQNAYYIVDSVLQTQAWLHDKPYVIMRNALVDEGQTLTIPAGARIYVHQDSRLFVLGNLKINGTATDSVVFQGDRIDPLLWIGDYLDIPGQWGGLYFFKESYGNEINYTILKNGGAVTTFLGNQVTGATIQVDKDTVLNGTPKLKITNSVIRSSQGYGLLAFGGSIDAENCKIVECGGENVMAFEGGVYHFYDCTIATYGSTYLNHTSGNSVVMGLLNYRPTGQTTYESAPLYAEVKNCIVYGSLENEVVVDAKDDHPATIIVTHSLLKSAIALPTFVQQSALLFNQDPAFVAPAQNDHHLSAGSPAIGSGTQAGLINMDLDGVVRSNPPSIGCYEFQP